MELRPRKGRAAQPSSTPSAAKPSARQPPQSVSRRKQASVPSSPILIPSDDEATHPKQSHDDVVDSPPVVQENHDSILSAETPLSDFVKSRRKDLSSTIKQKKKTALNASKKLTEVRPTVQQDTIAMEYVDAAETITENELGREKLSLADIEPDEICKRETCQEANPRKVEQTRMVNKKTRRSVEIVSSTCEAQCSMPSIESLKETDQSNIESLENNEKNFEKPDGVVVEEDVGNECTQTSASQELSCRDPLSGNEKDEETGRGLDDALEVKLNKKKGVAMHIEDHNHTDDDNDSNASSSSDEDEGDLASIFASSMKAHLHISEPSVFGKSTAMQSEHDVQKEEESLFAKDAIEGSHFNGNISRSAGYGLSWSPQVALSASKHCRQPQVGSLEARPNKIWEKDRCLQDGLCVPPLDPGKLNKLGRKQKKDTTGDKWYNLSAATITPDLKKELQLVKLRGVLDPKRHYKAEDSKGLPKYFQVGTVIGGPADFYSGRLTKKEQKNSLANELLSDSSLSAYRKRKYLEIQGLKQAGGKGFMKKKKSKRTPAWAKI